VTLACYYISNNLSLPLDITLSNILRYGGKKCDTSPLLFSTYKAYVTKKVRYKYRGYVLPPFPSPLPPLGNEMVQPGPTNLILFRFKSLLYSLSPPPPSILSLSTYSIPTSHFPPMFEVLLSIPPLPPPLPIDHVIVSCRSVTRSYKLNTTDHG